MVTHLRIATLRWAVGVFCCVSGASILIVPNQFSQAAYTGLLPNLAWWGCAFLAGGGGLLASEVLAPARLIQVGANLFASVVLLLIAQSFGSTGAVAGLVVYGVLGISTLFAPLIPRRLTEPPATADVFALVVAASATLLGGAVLALPDQFRATRCTDQRGRSIGAKGRPGTRAVERHCRGSAPGTVVLADG